MVRVSIPRRVRGKLNDSSPASGNAHPGTTEGSADTTGTPKNILVVDNDAAVVRALRFSLEQYGYLVTTAADGPSAIAFATSDVPDLIIMDIWLPVLDGLRACKEIRKTSGVPIIMLSDRDEEDVKVLAFELGADDCVAKPFSPSELLARVKARLRRSRLNEAPSRCEAIRSGGIVLDPARHALIVRGSDVALGPKQFSLLRLLMENGGRVMPRTTLLDKVWGYDFHGSHETISVHMRWLRKKIEIDPNRPQLLITVRSRGYMFSAGSPSSTNCRAYSELNPISSLR